MTGSRRNQALLALILLASTACSFWFASAELNGKNWDEGHSMRNIRSILSTGSWRPSFPFYPALSHLPQAALMAASERLHEATGRPAFEILRPNGVFTATAYLIGRSTSILYSLGILLLIYRLGRRMFSEETGLLAVAVLAISPFFLKIAGTYKPDALLVLTTLGAFAFALRATEQGRAKHYLLAGATVGLSAAAKQNGAFSSIPLVVATALAYRDARRWLLLIAAGAASVAVFLVFNPWPELLPEYLSMGERYQSWAQDGTMGAPHTLAFAAGLPFVWSWHGQAFGALTWLGLAGLAVEAFRKRRAWPESAGGALLVLFVLAYPLACWLVSSRPKPNIFVPTLPFTALAAAWALLRVRELLLAHLSKPAARSATWLVGTLLFATAAIPYANYLYSVAVPTTSSPVSKWIQRDAGFLGQRFLVNEADALRIGRRPLTPEFLGPLELLPERLSDLPFSVLDLADYEVFPRSALEGNDRAFYEARVARLGRHRVRDFAPRLFRLRGESLVVLAHPWRAHRPKGVSPGAVRNDVTAAAVPIDWLRKGRTKLSGRLPRRLAPADVVSLDAGLGREQLAECALEIAGAEVELHLYRRLRGTTRYMTQRFSPGRRSAPVRFRCPRRELLEPAPEIGVIRWVRPRPKATGG